MKKLILFAAVATFAFASCKNCYDCTECDDAVYEEEFCYEDFKDDYDSRSDFKDGIEDYETVTGCTCK